MADTTNPRELAELVRTAGGFTLTHSGRIPSSGYVVAVSDIPSDVIAADSPELAERIAAFRRIYAGRDIGAWHDETAEVIVLDVVEIVPSRAAAIAAGIARNQVAVWDIAAAREIPTNGTGNYRNEG